MVKPNGDPSIVAESAYGDPKYAIRLAPYMAGHVPMLDVEVLEHGAETECVSLDRIGAQSLRDNLTEWLDGLAKPTPPQS